jgi:curli biogenesis system outer membrane secretion channel CsgG
MRVSSRLVVATVLVLGLNGCVTGMDSSNVLSTLTGGTAPSGEAPDTLPQCTSPVATVTLVEQPIEDLVEHGLSSPLPLLRLMAQQSKCLTVVERGRGFSQAEHEYELARKGLLNPQSGMGKGQMIAADFAISPSVEFFESSGAGTGTTGLLSTFIPGLDRLRPAVDSLNIQKAQVVLLLTDNRTSAQVAAAEGSASQMDLGGGMALFDALNTGEANSYTRSPEGKVVAAAMLNAFAAMVPKIRELKGTSLSTASLRR